MDALFTRLVFCVLTDVKHLRTIYHHSYLLRKHLPPTTSYNIAHSH